MSSQGPSKVALGGRSVVAAIGLQRAHAKFPVGAAVAAMVLIAGAALAPLARRAWAHLALQAKPSPNDVSVGNGALPNDAEDLGRAENEGMPPGLS